MAYKLREDALRALQKHYQENKSYYYTKKKEYVASNLAKVNVLKDDVCKDCGIRYNPHIMDFDHSEGEDKIGDIARMIRRGCSFKKIKEEIKKCDLVCSNCHRERTYRRNHSQVG